MKLNRRERLALFLLLAYGIMCGCAGDLMKVRVVLANGAPMVINVEPWAVRRFRAKGLEVEVLPDLRPFMPGAFDLRFPLARA